MHINPRSCHLILNLSTHMVSTKTREYVTPIQTAGSRVHSGLSTMPWRTRRHQHFFHIPVAHVILYGIFKDFWNLWLRPKKDVLAYGNEYIMPTHVRAEISKRAPAILLTELFKKPYTDILKYDVSHFNTFKNVCITT